MPKVELEFDIDELEDAEYTEGTFSRYTGEVPPAGTILTGYVSKMWLSETKDKDEMLIAVFHSEENPDDLAEYDELEIWEYLALTASAKFRWAPFIDAFGIKLSDIKSKMKLEPEDDTVGAPITHIGGFEVGGDASWCRIVTARERYKGEQRAKVDKWLPYDAEEDDGPAPDPEPEPTPIRGGRTSARPAASAKPSTRSTTTRATKARATETVEADADEPDEAPATPARRGGRTARPAPADEAKPATRGTRRGTRAAVDQEPPF